MVFWGGGGKETGIKQGKDHREPACNLKGERNGCPAAATKLYSWIAMAIVAPCLAAGWIEK